jgi:hypothetical protein
VARKAAALQLRNLRGYGFKTRRFGSMYLAIGVEGVQFAIEVIDGKLWNAYKSGHRHIRHDWMDAARLRMGLPNWSFVRV